MSRCIKAPYDPLIILLLPRWSEAVAAIQAIYRIIDEVDYVLAITSGCEEARVIRQRWLDVDDLPLLIARVDPSETVQSAVDAVAEISKANSDRPIGVLLADGPDAPDYWVQKRRQWNRLFAEKLHRTVNDSQVFEYSQTWMLSPPRVR
jgi:hypothetical protein